MPDFKQALIVRSDAAATHVREDELFRTWVVAVTDEAAAVAAARQLQDEGVQLLELYGGFGPTAAAAVVAATGGQIPVGAVGFEGAPEAAAIVELFGADPARDRWRLGPVTVVGVGDREAVPAVAAELAAAGAERIELCGGLGVQPAAAAIAAVGDRAQVAPVLFGFESLPGAAAFRARFEALVS